jgi:hypothetical protein
MDHLWTPYMPYAQLSSNPKEGSADTPLHLRIAVAIVEIAEAVIRSSSSSSSTRGSSGGSSTGSSGGRPDSAGKVAGAPSAKKSDDDAEGTETSSVLDGSGTQCTVREAFLQVCVCCLYCVYVERTVRACVCVCCLICFSTVCVSVYCVCTVCGMCVPALSQRLFQKRAAAALGGEHDDVMSPAKPWPQRDVTYRGITSLMSHRCLLLLICTSPNPHTHHHTHSGACGACVRGACVVDVEAKSSQS